MPQPTGEGDVRIRLNTQWKTGAVLPIQPDFVDGQSEHWSVSPDATYSIQFATCICGFSFLVLKKTEISAAKMGARFVLFSVTKVS
jgi:hypothetical protein